MQDPDAEALARGWPKVLMHEYLDGGLRVATVFALPLEDWILNTLFLAADAAGTSGPDAAFGVG